mgnify:CR=1 FL=1
MLTGVLLCVIGAPRRVHHADDTTANGHRRGDDVHDSVPIVHDVDDVDLVQAAEVERLAPRRRIERRAIEHDGGPEHAGD